MHETLPAGSLLPELEPGIDPQLAALLETYLTDLEQGAAPDRQAFLAQHPQHAAALESYLPWIELLYQAKPRDVDATANPPMPARLGDFRIVREIGRGGMGVVYEAEQISLKRRVALKVLPFASLLDERPLARFKNEAQAAAQLYHPHIVPVFAVGCERGMHFYVMQLIEGCTLDQFIQRPRAEAADPVPPDTTTRVAITKVQPTSSAALQRFHRYARWFIQAAEALDHAHNQGIVHRDIKPSNLMISEADDLWVTDFGLARTQRDASMTASGELLGTLRYMSPEQLRSKPGIVDHRTDIYSLGLSLYELIAQRPALPGQTHQELVRQIEHEEPISLRRLDASVPRDLASIVAKAICKLPEGRYASAQELSDDLRNFMAGRPTQARPATWRDQGEKWIRRHARLAAAVGMGLMLILVCGAVSTGMVWRARMDTDRALVLASENHLRAEAHLHDARQVVDQVFTGVATQLGEVPGAEPIRRQLLNQALAYYQKFAQQGSADPAVRSETASAHYRCGRINEQLGDDQAAAQAYAAARHLWIQERTLQPAADQLRLLALCENNLGLILLRAGEADQAENHLRSAMRLQHRLTIERPQDLEARRELALSHANLAMVLGQRGKSAEARACLQQAIDLQRDDANLAPLARGDRGAIYNQLGVLCSDISADDAEAAFHHAVEDFERLIQESPLDLRWQAQLATTLNNRAALAAQANRLATAEADYRRAVNIQRELTRSAPQVVAHARDLAVTQNNLGYLLSRQNHSEPAIEQFQQAREILTHLSQEHAKSPEFASRLGAVCNNLGLTWENLDQVERAEAAYREAISWQQQALALSPNWGQAQDYLAAHLTNLDRLLQTANSSITPRTPEKGAQPKSREQTERQRENSTPHTLERSGDPTVSVTETSRLPK